MLRQKPHAIGKIRIVDRAVVVKLHIVRVIPLLADAVVVDALQALIDHIDRAIHVRFIGDDLGDLLPIRHHVDKFAGLENGSRHRACRIRIVLHEFGRRAKGFFRMIFPDALRGLDGEADLVVNGAVVPGFAHAEAVHIADAHVGDHLRRRHHNIFYILEWIDADTGEPVVKPHRMGAGGKGLRKGIFGFVFVDECLQSCAVFHAFLGKFIGERDRLPVVIQVHQDGHVFLRPADARVHAVDQAVQHVCGIEFAVDQFVAHARPRGFFGGHDLDAVFLVELHHRGDHHGRAIGQWNEADFHFLLFRRIRTRGPRG